MKYSGTRADENWGLDGHFGTRRCVSERLICRNINCESLKLYEPLAATDGYDRTTDHPELIAWYARVVDALKHDQIARRIHQPPDDRAYESREARIRRRLRNPVIGGEPDSPESVYDALRDYRGYLSHDTLEAQDDSGCRQMGFGASLRIVLDLSPDYECYAEYRATRQFARDGDADGAAGLGCTVDAAIEDDGQPLAVEIKTGARILQRHRAQATVQADMVFADPVIVHLPLNGEAEVYTPEADDEWRDSWHYWERIKAEAVTLFERI